MPPEFTEMSADDVLRVVHAELDRVLEAEGIELACGKEERDFLDQAASLLVDLITLRVYVDATHGGGAAHLAKGVFDSIGRFYAVQFPEMLAKALMRAAVAASVKLSAMAEGACNESKDLLERMKT